ncbi:TPA: hypothetical protein QCX24_005869 [Bacillus toyonensis]|uniref:hypothetical protein n=1 Tax=Bacillus toyonensis TaxID=155322 RepID=UPI000BF96351|nr:hypothetical protein [Bacillus toyonensis]PFZ74876.1 hypothetical protein COL82_21510 [Bacillus toyonensis]PHA81940.1 hypothetical protein COE74_27270 [Bacillus toyonensis]PHB32820.1 hypothetical protein COE86_23910 [Bacillus toyonensis]QWI08939.1 hypothetical protein EXW54_30725 [Bacillus toyonensis]HDR7386466.1 hypothetical protein [Bacillus toyonensis]
MRRRLAQKLVDAWDGLGRGTKWAIEQIAGSGIWAAIEGGVGAVVDFLSDCSDWVVEKINNLF